MARTYPEEELAREAGAPEDRVRWMTDIGLVAPDRDCRFTYGAALVVRMTSALIASGVPARSIEHAAPKGS